MGASSNPIDFSSIRTIELLCLHLQCAPEALQRLLRSPQDVYVPTSIPRKAPSTRPRVVYDVTDETLRQIHRTVSEALQDRVDKLGEHVQGFRRERSIFSHAAQHCQKPHLVTADIRDFFEHIPLSRVVEVFIAVGCTHQTAFVLARLCCLNGRLPQGGRASPAIANLVLQPLDLQFLEAGANRYTYSRYADDLAFSGSQVPTALEVRSTLESHGFQLRPDSYSRPRGLSSRWVTGLNVGGAVPRVSKRKRRRLERLLFAVEKYGARAFQLQGGEDSFKWLHGNLLWLKKYDACARGWWQRLDAVIKRDAEELKFQDN